MNDSLFLVNWYRGYGICFKKGWVMRRLFKVAVVLGLAAAVVAEMSAPADAWGSRQPSRQPAEAGGGHRASSYYRGGPQVRGYIARRGGYSYSAEDAINTYGDSRSLYGGASSYRDPMLDRQTRFGPFDHGFFFDSGIAPRGGDSPYQN
jgi:hypothetical protein